MKELAQLALEKYGLAGSDMMLLQDMWNTTYCVTDSNDRQYNLRINGGALQELQKVEDELTFLDFVARRQQVRVPKPVRALAGELVVPVETADGFDKPERRLCCLFEWIDGSVVRENLSDSVLHKMGSAAARLHQAAQEFRFPTPDDPFREGYHHDETVILQHREWLAKLEAEIAPDRVKLIHNAVDHVLHEFGEIDKVRNNYGYIHADLNPNNYIVTNAGLANEEVSVIDFEQLGRGFFHSDFAVMKAELIFLEQDVDRLWASFKAGYQSVMPLPFDHDDELEPFIMAGDLAFLDWIYNTPSPHVREHWHTRFEATHDKIRGELKQGLI